MLKILGSILAVRMGACHSPLFVEGLQILCLFQVWGRAFFSVPYPSELPLFYIEGGG